MESASGLRRVSPSWKFSLVVVGLGILLALPSASFAAPLAGTTLTNPTDTVFSSLIPIGTPEGFLLASLISPYSFATTAGTTSGTLTSAVYRNPSGTLDFYYQVANAGISSTAIARETDTSFAGFTTWTGYRVDGASLLGGIFVDGTVAPITADRNGPGTVVGFSFQPPDAAKVLPGSTSNVVVISTNATEYTAGNAALIDGGTQTVAAFQPTAVPEPGTLALLGAGLLAIGGFRRHRR